MKRLFATIAGLAPVSAAQAASMSDRPARMRRGAQAAPKGDADAPSDLATGAAAQATNRQRASAGPFDVTDAGTVLKRSNVAILHEKNSSYDSGVVGRLQVGRMICDIPVAGTVDTILNAPWL